MNIQTKRIGLRISEKDRELFERAAELEHLKLSTYIKKTVTEHAKRILAGCENDKAFN